MHSSRLPSPRRELKVKRARRERARGYCTRTLGSVPYIVWRLSPAWATGLSRDALSRVGRRAQPRADPRTGGT